MATVQFSDLYNGAARWAGDTTTTGIARAKDAVAEAVNVLSYGLSHPPLKPWWRKREDSWTPVAGTQSYAVPSAQGTFESLHQVWYRMLGDSFDIEIVDDERWRDETNENTTIGLGTPEIINLYSDAAGSFKLRVWPIPSTAFISQIDGSLIRCDLYIEETLTSASADSAEPLMPNSRRWGIVWKAVEFLAARQGDLPLVQWAAAQGQRYYEMIFNDDVARLGFRTRRTRPMDPVGRRGGVGQILDYGHPR